MDCQFCNLANGREASNIVYQTTNIACFLDIDPINDGHVLIVPKRHVLDTEELDSDTRSEVMDAVVLISKSLKKLYQADGVSIMQNGGVFNDAGHYHMHVFPRYKKDGFAWIDRTSLVKEKDLRKVANNLIKVIQLL